MTTGTPFETRPFYRTPAAEAEAHALYDEARAALPFATEERTIETRLGATHVLVAGPEGAPDVVMLQGGNVVSPLTLAWLAPLTSRLRIWGPATLGQPGRSAGVRPVRDAAFGPWLVDVLDGLDLRQPAFVAASQGVGPLLELVALAPERIRRAALVVPSGMVATPLRATLLLAAGYFAYRLRPGDGRSRSTLRILTGGREPDELMVRATSLSFGGTELETSMPPLATSDRVAGLRAPVLVLAGARDPLFPAARVLPRARELFPTLVAAETLPGAHLPGPEDLRLLAAHLGRFLLPDTPASP
ncbi:MAG: alpha/beta fold hydrolase [Chloroflexota bacterium]